MQTNTTKAKIKAGQATFGCFVRYPDATLIEVMGYHDWDFLVFDGEHGTVEPRDAEHMTRAAELRGVTPIVRVTTNLQPTILRYMDTGAHGLIVPWVNTAAQAEAAVRSVKYHPRGIRGVAGVRASDYSQAGTLTDYVQRANAETLVVLQVETLEAVDNLPAILDVPDIDVIFIGPNDLAHSMGLPGQIQHPDVQAMMQRIANLVTRSDKALGLMIQSIEGAKQWRDRGARFISINFETILRPATLAYLKAVREP
jgi:4-hydroxy-2-oxoheptanedioate aldolase